MYFYCYPAELMKAIKQDTVQFQLQLPTGSILVAERADDMGRIRVVSLLSTDPMEYLDARFQPGAVITVPSGAKIQA